MEEIAKSISWDELSPNGFIKRVGVIFNKKWLIDVVKEIFMDESSYCLNLWYDGLVKAPGRIQSPKYVGTKIECSVEVTIQGIENVLLETIMSFKTNQYIQSKTSSFSVSKRDFPIKIYLKFIRKEIPKTMGPPDLIMQSTSANLQLCQLNKQQNSSIIKKPSTSKKFDLCLLNELSQDLQDMFLQENLSDVTIRCKSTVFKVNKIILCARSPVFKTMFANPMQENITDTVTLDNMDTEIVRSMIQFMYTGKISITSMADASCFLDVAEQYQMKSLKDGLIRYLKANLSEQNALTILEMAELYDNILKKDAIKFISGHFNTMKHEKEWEELKLSKPLLALEVYSYNDRLH